jgi:uncharacterized protein YbcV (DUF1398 family)
MEVKMKNQDEILKLSTVSKNEKWSYPKTFEKLRELGIAYYDVNLLAKEIVYHNKDESFKEKDIPSFQNLPSVGQFDEQAIKEAIKRHQKGETSYAEVMRELMQVGVTHYRVDMHARTCTYFGKNSNEIHIEHVPEWKNDE